MKSRHRLLFSFFIFHFSFFTCKAQTDFNFSDEFALDTLATSKIILHSGYFFSSNAATNRIATEYGRNGFITDEMKDGVSKNLKDKNRFGGGYDANLFFVFHPDTLKKNLGVYGGVRIRNHIDSRFSRDLFEVYFRGNKNYAGKTADFSDSEVSSYQYKQFTAGLANAYPLHNGKLFLGLGINITAGRRFTKIESRHSTFYTHPDGEYLDGDFDITYQRDDSAKANLIPTEGKGIALNFFAEYENHSNNKFFIGVENLGNIFWNLQYHYELDPIQGWRPGNECSCGWAGGCRPDEPRQCEAACGSWKAAGDCGIGQSPFTGFSRCADL